MANASGNTTPTCWDFMKCPREVCTSCPAYPDCGLECWKLTGTKCRGGEFVKASFDEKILYCRNECDYYKIHLKKLYP
ncbi:MAG: hypothetical protein P8Y85_00665 [Nitrospirota bacterium]